MTDATLARTISSQLVDRLRARIIEGVYAPGSTLAQDGLAAEFGVSKIPVREALVQLQAEGLVDVFAHRGFNVRQISVDELQELFRLRALIEPVAAVRGAALATADDRAAATALLEQMTAALRARRLLEIGVLNQRFHIALIAPLAQPVMAETLQRLHVRCRRYVALHVQPKERTTRVVAEHTAIHAAWMAGRTREVQKLIREHVEATEADVRAALAAGQTELRA
jgi:DNA-binding GntR family transcriptional regulator